MQYKYDWLTGAYVRRVLEEEFATWAGEFIALDVKRTKGKVFSDGDKDILSAISLVRNMLAKHRYALFRFAGDEFVLLPDETALKFFRRNIARFKQKFHIAIARKQFHDDWMSVFDTAYEKMKGRG